MIFSARGERVLILNKMIDLTKFGNFKDYMPKNRIVKSHKPVYVEDKATVKLYTMFCSDTDPLSSLQIEWIRGKIWGGFDGKELEPKIGLGFAILSEDVLNVNMWGGSYPSLINPQVYTFPSFAEKNHQIRPFKKQDIKDVGAYCAWEGAIVGHESEVWRKYMHSNRTEQDKKLWLMNSYNGKISTVTNSLAGKKLSELDLSTRDINSLGFSEINNVGELIKKTENQLRAIRGIGEFGLKSIIKKLDEFDLQLKEEE